MITFIYGGSSSGKSAFAEDLACRYSTDKYYLATMAAFDAESLARIDKHRRARAGKGFETIECPTDVYRALEHIHESQPSTILLECISNLVANEMFGGSRVKPALEVSNKITADVSRLAESVDNIVIVSNNIFEDGIAYDEGTTTYLEALGLVNQNLLRKADEGYEVVVGIPIKLK